MSIDFVDLPDRALVYQAARLWKTVEQSRVVGVEGTEVLDQQERGFIDTMGRIDAWLSVAVSEERVIGCVGAFPAYEHRESLPTMYVAYLAVDPAHRGVGVGRSLMLRAEQRSCAAGSIRMTLTVHEGNARARSFYERLGWKVTGRTQTTPPANEVLLEYAKDLGQPAWVR